MTSEGYKLLEHVETQRPDKTKNNHEENHEDQTRQDDHKTRSRVSSITRQDNHKTKSDKPRQSQD